MKGFYYILLIPFIWACSKENSLTVNLNSLSNSLVPSFSDSIQYRSSKGDTISLFPISSSKYYEKQSGSYDQGGSLGDLDYLEEQRAEFLIGNVKKNIQLKWKLSANYQNQRPMFSRDAFSIFQIDTNGQSLEFFTAEIQDSLICELQNQKCNRLDSLRIENTSYLRVFHNESQAPRAYISPSNGLIKFIDKDSVVFELIP
tara:strand:+ start:1673 stop:2275 length:603 start_codon:yes stop_codon:yes gene_type:complete